MAQRNIDFGSFPDDPNADAIRTAFQKVQENFSELFSGLQEQAVISVNRTAGTGTTVNSPTGNVIISANIAQVRIQSSTLDLSTGSNASPASLAVINQGTVPIFINLPQSVTGISNITLGNALTANTVNVNLQINGNTANFTGNIATTANVNANNANITNNIVVGANANVTGNLNVTTNANVTANVNAGNINATARITAANANITANVNANIINANFLYGDGSNLTNVSAVANTRILNGTSYANISTTNGNLNIVIAGNPTMTVAATGANVTGTLGVSGNLTAGNLIGVLANGGTSNITIAGATGNVTTAVSGTARITATSTGANVTGTLGVSGNANVGNLGTAQVLASANVTAPQLISNIATGTAPLVVTSTTQVANLNAATAGTATSATTAGTVTTAAQPNITSVGTLSSLAVTANITAGNVYANSGTVGASLLTGTLTTASQPNITGVGTLTALGVNGNITAANITANTGVFTGNGSGLSALNASNLSTGTVPSARLTGSYSISVDSATTAGTVTTAAQPNITSVGTLTGLGVNGTITAANITANTGVFTGNGNGLSSIVGANVTGTVANATTATLANTINVTTQTSGNAFLILGNAVTGNVSETANAAFVANTSNGALYATTFIGALSGAATTAGTVTTAAQPNITSVGTLANLSVTANVTAGNVYANSGTVGASLLTGTLTTAAQPNVTSVGTLANLSVTANVTAGNVYANSGTIGASLLTGTLTTAAQPNVTSVGTLTGLGVNGNITAANITANTGVFAGNAAGLTSIPGSNVLGAVASATTSGTVTTAAQPNITSVGTLSSLSVSGNLSSGNANLGNAARANFFVGDGSLLTNISVGAGSFIANGNSNVSVTSANGNVAISAVGNANILVITGTGANINGTANVSGNLSAGNISATSIAGNLTTAAQTNITSLGTLTGLNVNGVSNLGPNSNVIITGGVANAFLRTNGSGNLTWDTATLVPAQGANTQVIFNDGGSIYAGSAALTFNKTSNVLTLGGNLSVGNISGANNITSSFFTGTLRTNAQPNITSVGTLTTLGVNNTITAVSFTANTGVFTGNGSGLSALDASNISTGTLASGRLTGTYDISITGSAGSATTATSATTAGTVTTAAQPNITSVGTLTGLLVNGNLSAANITVSAGTITSNLFSGNGASLTNLNGANVTGTVANATNATTAGTVTTAAQPNITSVGTLTSLGVNGTVTAVAFTANTGVFTGNGAALTTLNASNISSGTLAQARLANSSLTVNGTAISLGGSGTVTANTTQSHSNGAYITGGSFNGGTAITWAVDATDAATASKVVARDANASFAGNVITGALFVGSGANLTTLNASNISSGTLAQARLANSSLTVNGTAISLGGSGTVTANTTQILTNGTYITGDTFNGGTARTWAVDATDAATASKVVARDVNASFAGNVITGALFVGSGANLTALNASNISSGTLAQARLANSSLTVNGTAISLGGSGTVTANTTQTITFNNGGTGDASGTTFNGGTARTISHNSIGASPLAGSSSLTTTGTVTSGTWNSLFAAGLNANTLANIQGANVSGAVSFATTANAVAGANVTGTVANATFATNAGTVTTAAQGNITSVGTLTSLAVTGTTGVVSTDSSGTGSTTKIIRAVNGTQDIAFIPRAGAGSYNNLTGADDAMIVYANSSAQGNANLTIAPWSTASGGIRIVTVSNTTANITLTASNTITSGNISAGGYVIRSVNAGVSAAGSNQGTATAINREMNVVSTVAAGAGVILPVAVPGMVISITNTSANSLLVYPHVGGDINGATTNAAFTHTAGATLQYMAPTTSDWYTVGATYA
jgi:hypothetical protein